MNLNVTLVQTGIFWNHIDQNLIHQGELLRQMKGNTDLIVLPEMFNSGFVMEPPFPDEKIYQRTLKWMASQANENHCVLAGSIIAPDHGTYYNRMIWMKPGGSYEFYDKRHLFRMSGEDKHFSPGNKRLVTELKGWNIMPLICYDLRFPVWSRNRNDYDILIYLANWPENRIDVWKTLLKARAIENQCFVIGVNRTGRDFYGTNYPGHSVILDYKGNAVLSINEEQTSVQTGEISLEKLVEFRNKFPVYTDADRFEIL